MDKVHYQVLEVLRGQSILIEGLTPEQKTQIKTLSEPLTLDELIGSIPQRSSTVILTSRIEDLSPLENERLFDRIRNGLKIEKGIKWFQDSQEAGRVNFQTDAEHYLFLLKNLLNCPAFPTSEHSMALVVQSISCYSMLTPWTTETSLALHQQILKSCVPYTDIALATVSQSLIQSFKKLTQHGNNVSKAGYKDFFHKGKNGLNPSLGLHESQSRFEWKSNDISSLAQLSFLIEQSDLSAIKGQYWGLIVPSILNVIDDHEIEIKLVGVKILSSLLRKFQKVPFPQVVDHVPFLKQTGLFEIFIESMLPVLTYLPSKQLQVSSELSSKALSLSYDVCFQLISSFVELKSRDMEYIKILNSNIFHSVSLVRDNVPVLSVLLSKIIVIVQTLSMKTLKCLPRLLFVIGNLISDPFLNPKTAPLLLEHFLEIIKLIELNCWMRLDSHKFDILTMLIMIFKKIQDDDDHTLKKNLDLCIRLLMKCIKDKDRMKSDLLKLTKADESLGPVFEQFL